MRWLVVAAMMGACTGSETTPDPAVTDGASDRTDRPDSETADDTATTTEPCDVEAGVGITKVSASQPFHANEAEFTVSVGMGAAVAVACTAVDDPDEVHLVEESDVATEHVLRMGGLLADTAYDCVAAAVCPRSPSEPHTFSLTTGSLKEPTLPGVTITVDDGNYSPDYLALTHERDGVGDGTRLMLYDHQGRVRWYARRSSGAQAMNFAPASGGFTTAGAWPPNVDARPRLIDLFGSAMVYDSGDDIPGLGSLLFHHDGRQLADGRYLTLEEPVIQDGNGGTFRGVGTRIVNPATGKVDFEWTSQRGFDEGDLPRGFRNDAYHVNWIDLVETGGQSTIYMSFCFQNLTVAVDVPSGDVRWSFGPGGDFSLVDTEGNALPDTSYTECQHGLQYRDGHLLVYDNGRPRGYSRASEYLLDENTMTATLLWTWTEPNWFERSLGGVDWTSTGTVMIGMGHGESFSPSPGDRSTVAEIDPASGEKLWELQYNEAIDITYRVEAVDPCDLFGNAAVCNPVADRLAALAPVLGLPE